MTYFPYCICTNCCCTCTPQFFVPSQMNYYGMNSNMAVKTPNINTYVQRWANETISYDTYVKTRDFDRISEAKNNSRPEVCMSHFGIENDDEESKDYERKETNDQKFLGSNNEYDKLKQIMEKMEVLSKTKKKQGADMHYHLRKDVITKTIFRAARKYFIKRFKAFYNFTKLSRAGFEELQIEIREKVRVFLRKLFREDISEVLSAIFIAVLDPKGIHIALETEGEEFRDLVYKLLFKFNKANMEQLMMYKEFIKLMSIFLREPDLVKIIVKSHRDKATEKAYQRQCDLMKTICESDSSIIPKILLTFL